MQHKQVFRRMELDKDVRSLQPGEYRKLFNAIPVSPKSASYPVHDVISNVIGNALVSYSLPSGTNKTIGFLEDRAGNRAFYFVYNNTAASNSIYQFSAGSITLVFRSALLDFAASDIIDADIIDDVLIFTNRRTNTYKIDVAIAIAGGYASTTLTGLTLIKRPPQLLLTLTSSVDGTFASNFIYGYTFQFYYRYVFENDDKSVFGPIASISTASTATTNNSIEVELSGSEVIPYNVKLIEYAVRVNERNEFVIYYSEAVSAGVHPSAHKFYNNVLTETVPDSEVYKWNDSVPKITQSLKIFKNRVFMFNNTEGYTYSPARIANITLATSNPATYPFKSRGTYQVGLMFFDAYGRHAGVQLGVTPFITIPDRTYNTLTQYGITWNIASVAQSAIPTWATHYAIVRTKCNNIGFFIQDRSADIFYYKKAENGTFTYNKTYSTNNTGVAVDISHFSNYKFGYTWSEGDRIRIYNATSTTDLLIRGQDGKFLLVDNHNASLNGTGSDNDIIEIYTPKGAQAEVFYEVGAKYAITSPGGGSRAFATTSGTLTGDITVDVIADRPTTYEYTGSYLATAPYGNTQTAVSPNSNEAREAMNQFSRYYDYWAEVTGRPIAYSPIGSFEILKDNWIRFSQKLIQGSTIFGLNTFEALDDYALPAENGTGTALAEAGDVLVAIHEIIPSALYIEEGFVSTANANGFLAKTDQVIGDDRNYIQKFGCQDPATVVSRDGRVYFLDKRMGAVLRRSQDGITVISNYGVRNEISTLCRTHEALGSDSQIRAGWDPQYKCYVISFININGPTGYTYYFHEDTNSWVCLTDERTDFWGVLNQRKLFFVSGAMYQQSIETNYNNWGGVQYNRRLEFETGQDSLVKIWDAVEIDVESIYTTAGTNEDILLLYLTNGGTLQTRINYADFQLKEGVYRSAFFRSVNDVSMANATESKYKSQIVIRSQSAFFVITNNSTSRNAMKSITIFFTPSMASNP